ncbi:CelD/BcsL family acetyltransferase involved in cellulose biosynthesis [Aminobacter aminovorans]|uniref:Protein involved in cellulose biosynthesis (CelD) n=1 Tax=Aminobacter aminovorans TaxID=83263 RepID=A0A380WQN2_AMIAI|nr:GNAT family N-acetyltransferase [Aminobacter aminovorans]TCS25881.1 CelD/BcsL family acetyltransferase involved in cellulose biosynthesis [Aminobacter aminovorans]SUU90454.1 Protein involved in cellulose biosynthesis (CelD) [Aminobacter aminovorans]
MVDATAPSENNTLLRHAATTGDATTAIALPVSRDVLSAYGKFTSIYAPAQSPEWVSTWIDANKPDAMLATLSTNGRPVLSVALEVGREGPFRIARFLGGKHANGNFPASDKNWLVAANAQDIGVLVRAIGKARPDIDLVAFDRLIGDFKGLPNPLLKLPSAQSPNVALAVDLDGGFEQVLTRTSGKKKRKRHRSQERKYEAVGGARRIMATTTAEANAMLDAFYAMKEQRFGAMGITDVFADASVRSFFRKLFVDALAREDRAFVLHGLEVGGKYRAVTGSSRAGNRLVCEFGAIADDELAYASPGEYLFFDNIAEASDQGFDIYDFSVGDEPYKRQWCDLEIQHADVLVPLTTKGRLYALGLRSLSRVKATVKNNDRLWALIKRLRSVLRGKPAATAAEED